MASLLTIRRFPIVEVWLSRFVLTKVRTLLITATSPLKIALQFCKKTKQELPEHVYYILFPQSPQSP